MLEVSDLRVRYGAIEAVQGVSFEVQPGRIVTLVGCNGAGKSSVLRCISGIVPACGGTVRLGGKDLTNRPPHEIVACGIAQAPEGRMVFSELTVRENLRMGAYLRRDKAGIAADLETCFALFERLRERQSQRAGTLSGGEQQMLAIARALMSRPKILLLDEPSLGIAPLLVRSIFRAIKEINTSLGVGILLVEQNAHLALQIADTGVVLETGRILFKDAAATLRADPRVIEAYLGGGA